VGRVHCACKPHRPICHQNPSQNGPSRRAVESGTSEHGIYVISRKGSRLTNLTKTTRNEDLEAEKPSVTLPGTVEKIIPSVHPSEPEKAQIGIEGADHLYREIRVENTLHDENGKQVALKPGAQVDVTIEADVSATRPKHPSNGHEPLGQG
jgi:hypothetical protein